MTISLIAAMDNNRVIGKDNALPWRLDSDLARFREITHGHPVIMGRKTFESIGHPLPNRTNIILTRDPDFHAKGCVIVHSIGEAREAAKGSEEVFVIGGENVFKEFLPHADKMYLTFVNAEVKGDTYFPEWNSNEWKEVLREHHEANEKNQYPYTFVNFLRKR